MIPKISVKKRSNVGPALFGTSSALMMTMDVALGACVSEGEKMGQEERIQNAYRGLGGKRTFYDGMITCSTLSGRAVCRLVWGMGRAETQDYLCVALSGIPEGFSGRLLEVPVGTGILTMPLYREMPEAEITCLDYSPEMLERAKCRGEGLSHVRFQQGDVGALPFGDGSFDIVLSLNGFHAFPDKEAAWREIFRVLRPGGIFCGCFYVTGQNRRTDWIIRRLYVPKGYFTPPFETAESLRHRLKEIFGPAKVRTVQSIASFACQKVKEEYS